MASFDVSQGYVKIREGGFQKNPKDAGNWTGGKVDVGTLVGTNFGISAPTLSGWLGRTATEADMRALTYQTALAIFKKNYWDALSLDQLANQSTATLVYDGAVNQGTGAMKSILRDSLASLGVVTMTTDPKILIQKANAVDPQKFFEAVKAKRKERYDRNTGHYAYSDWIDRLNKVTFFFSKK